jgi:chromosome segregation ATPase
MSQPTHVSETTMSDAPSYHTLSTIADPMTLRNNFIAQYTKKPLEEQAGLLAGGVHDVLVAVDGIEGEVRGLGQRIGALEQRMDGIEGEVRGLGPRIGALEQRMDGLEQRMDGLEQRMDGLEQRMDGLEQRMDRLEKNQEAMGMALGALGAKVDTMMDLLRGLVEVRVSISPNQTQ